MKNGRRTCAICRTLLGKCTTSMFYAPYSGRILRSKPKTATAGNRGFRKNARNGWSCTAEECWGRIRSGRLWRAGLPSGQPLEQAALEKLRTWASFLDPDVQHSAHVARIALQLYDALSQHQMLSGGSVYRRILEAAAIVHDVGRGKGADGHLKRGYRMISKLRPPIGWSEEELRCVGAVARYHRGALPKTGDSYFVGLSAKRRSELLPIMGILRLADAFDFAHDQKVMRITLEQRDGTLSIYGQGLEEISPTAERLARARYLLETTGGLTIRIRPLLAKAATSSRVDRGTRRVAVSY